MANDPKKIDGPPLAGFGEFFDDIYLGAAAKRPPAAPPPKKTPAAAGVKGVGVVMTKPPRQTKHSPHKLALVSLARAGKKALDAGKKAALHAPAKPAPAAAAKITTRVTAVGAAALTPKQRGAVQAHDKAMVAAKAAAVRLSQAGKKAASAGKAAADFVKKTGPYLQAKLAGKKSAKTSVGLETLVDCVEVLGGLEEIGDDELLGLLDAIGDVGAPYTPPQGTNFEDPTMQSSGVPSQYDPTVPGSTSTTTPLDPSLMTTIDSGLSGASAGQVVTGPDGSVLYDPATDPAIIPMPTRGQKMSLDDVSSGPWLNVPDDGIVYDGSRGWPRYSKGSAYYFYGPKNANGGQFGLVWGYDKMNMPASTETRWIKRFGQAAVTGNDNWDDGISSDAAAAAESAKSDGRNLAEGKVYGPLIGNPDTDFAGLQFATADNKWFWQSDNAPVWATAEVDSRIKAANKLTIATNMAAAQAQAAQMLKDAADLRAQQAAQDAQNALAESAAASQANVAQTQVTISQAQSDAASALQVPQVQQLMIEQAKVEQAEQTVQLDQNRQAGQLILDQLRRDMAREAAMPASAPGGYPGEFSDEGGGADHEEDGAVADSTDELMQAGDGNFGGEDE